MLNQLCRRFYIFISPITSPYVEIRGFRKCNDWLDFGTGSTQKQIRRIRCKISGEDGNFFGEFEPQNNKMIPSGRGVFHDKFAASKKLQLGYVKDGKWIQGS